MQQDIVKAVDPLNLNYNMEFSIGYKFTRTLPDRAKTAKSHQYKVLDMTYLPDCLTAKDLK